MSEPIETDAEPGEICLARSELHKTDHLQSYLWQDRIHTTQNKSERAKT